MTLISVFCNSGIKIWSRVKALNKMRLLILHERLLAPKHFRWSEPGLVFILLLIRL